MKTLKSKTLKSIWLCGVFSLVLAFNPSVQANDSLPQVYVEVIIFQSLALKGWTEEYWPENQPLPNTSNVTVLNGQDGYARRVGDEQLTLQQERSRMTTDRGYDVLAHFGWIQNAYPRSQAKPIFIDAGIQKRRVGASNLFGTITMYQGRFNHIEIDLELDRRIPHLARERFAEQQQIDLEWLPESWRFQIQESRRVRPGQLHYIDHPIYGILVKVDPIR